MKKILVVIDVQNDFVDGSLGSAEARAAIPAIVERIRDVDYDCIIATRDTHGEDYLSTKEGERLPVKHCIMGTEGHEIREEVAEAISSVCSGRNLPFRIIDKPSFGSPALVDAVRDCITPDGSAGDGTGDGLCPKVELIGFCTDICVISNALLLKAGLYETADICVNAGCCAGVTPELHREALDVMRSCQIDVI